MSFQFLKSWLNKYVPTLGLALFGHGFACLGGGQLYLNQRYSHEGRTALATFTTFTSHRTPKSQCSYAEYTFLTLGDEQIKGNRDCYDVQVGQQVRIEYLPSAPTLNRFVGAEERNRNWNMPMLVGASLFFVAGIYSWLRMTRVG